MILQLLARSPIAGRQIGMIIQQNESGGAAGECFAGNHQRMYPHVRPRLRIVIRQHEKRIGAVQIVAGDPDRPVIMSGQRHRKRRPMIADLVEVRGEGVTHVGADAIDMDMQLVLRAPERRIDRQ